MPRDTEWSRTQLEQLETLKLLLQRNRTNRHNPAFQETIEWVRNFPQSLKMFERENIRNLVCESFDITQEELDEEIVLRNARDTGNGPEQRNGTNILARRLEQELDSLLPRSGFLRRYVDYTAHSEAPLLYHVFCALCAVGAVINRRVWFDMGYYRLYPTLGVIILGPSGIKKTSAANIATDLLNTCGVVKIYSEKLTPEALIESMQGGNATGLIYAPELTVFLNRQKYNEGLVQIITRFMDCPDLWKSETIGRGERVLRNVGISSLMCSTLDWFVKSTPEDSFGGGFIARNMLIVQEASARCEPIPVPGDVANRDHLVNDLSAFHELEGQATLSTHALQRYEDWYGNEHQDQIKHPDHEMLATYYNRKPDHIKRIAIILHIIEHRDIEVCYNCFDTALRIVNWTEQFLPTMLEQMFKTGVGESQEQILRLIRNAVKMTHSDLVRKMQYKMNASELRNCVQSLKEAHLVTEHVNNIGHYYTITEEKGEGTI